MEKKRSRPFIAVRKQHLVETAEDYTELIADLVEAEGEARTCEIAANLGVTHVTVIRTLRRLQNEGFLETAPHKPVTLTQKGKKLASQAKKRHQILLDFLLKLGVPEDIAELDAEGMEHHISPITLNAIRQFIES
jgi:DtxR family manganese transport transcriptional regulator